MNTNDAFEVRRTFRAFAGKKFRDALLFEMRAQKLDEAIRTALAETGLPASIAAELSRNTDLAAHLIRQVNAIVDDVFIPSVNSDEFFEEILFRFGAESVALSLTEDNQNSVMWAHYAGNSSGFVLEFDSNNQFFKTRPDGSKRTLQKISYFDDEIEELMDDPRKALMSKTTGWSYEKEWRLYTKPEEADVIVRAGDEDIHLFKFPVDALRRIIIGHRASLGAMDEIKNVVKIKYPHCEIIKLNVDRINSRFLSEKII